MQAEFWRLPQVISRVGLSRSEIYRRIGTDEFPKPRPFPNSRKKFWLSTEVIGWQERVLSA